MMLKVILAYDGSVQAKKAADCLSWWPASDLNVIAVTAVQGPSLNEQGDAVDVHPERRAEAESKFRELGAVLETRGIALQYRIVAGDPRDVVVDIAQVEGADLILTGSRGLNFARRMLLGSVSSEILHNAPCPVLLVR